MLKKTDDYTHVGIEKAAVTPAALHPAQYYPDPLFFQDMSDLFMRRRAGHIIKHVLKDEAYDAWEESTHEPGYYPFASDVALITEHAGFYGDLAAKAKEDKKVTLVELGLGSEFSATMKTLNFVNAINPDAFIGVDVSDQSLETGIRILKEKRPDIKREVRLRDFDREDLNLPADGLTIMAQFGCTGENIAGFYDDVPPFETFTSGLENQHRNLKKGDYFIQSLDLNQDQESLDECYSSPFITQFFMATLHRAKKELPVQGFDPGNFAHTRFWNKENSLYGHGYRVKKDNMFMIGNEVASWKENEIVCCSNSWRFRRDFIDAAYAKAGFEVRKVLPDQKGWIHHFVTQRL